MDTNWKMEDTDSVLGKKVTMRVVKCWRGCEIFSLEVFKIWLDMALSQLISLNPC